MRAVIVNCFDTYEDRVDLVNGFLRKQGYDVTVIQSNFRHFKKEYRKEEKDGFVFVKTKPYYKNISFSRLYSHYKYSNASFKIVEEIKPNLLYVLVPPNSLAKLAVGYKQKNKDTKIIFDLIDLWPETMPIGKSKNYFPIKLWGTIRDKSLKHADFVITECNLYRTVLGSALKGVKTDTVYLAKNSIDVTSNLQLSEDEIHLAYLGSINNIIDIPKIKEIIQVINDIKPVTLHIIGDGENKQELIREAKLAGATVKYHGEIYNPQEKQDIFDKCHFGLNIMKENVCVGLTMKSIDYLQHGLPIINNIPADTAEIVEKYGAGVNLANKNFYDIANTLCKVEQTQLLSMRRNCYKLFDDIFSQSSFFDRINVVKKIL